MLEVVHAEAEEPVRRGDGGTELRLCDLAALLVAGGANAIQHLGPAREDVRERRESRVAGGSATST